MIVDTLNDIIQIPLPAMMVYFAGVIVVLWSLDVAGAFVAGFVTRRSRTRD